MHIKAFSSKKLYIDYLPMLLTAVLIIVFAFRNEQSFFRTLPTIVTLFVQILLCRANRFGFLLGGVNSIIYAAVFFSEGLYFSAISAGAISFPIQIYSFFNWSRNTSKNKTELKKFSTSLWIFCIVIILVGWVICYFGLSGLFSGARLPIFDTFSFVCGIVISVFAALRYVNSQYISAFSCIVSSVMWIIICASSPNNVNYLIISFYNFFMVTKAAVRWTKQYNENQNELQNQTN